MNNPIIAYYAIRYMWINTSNSIALSGAYCFWWFNQK